MPEIWEYGVYRSFEEQDLSLLAQEEKGELSSGRSRRLVPDPGLSSPVSRTGVTTTSSSSSAPASALLLLLAALLLAPCLLAASLEPAFCALSPLSTLSVLPRRARLTACPTFHYKIYFEHWKISVPTCPVTGSVLTEMCCCCPAPPRHLGLPPPEPGCCRARSLSGRDSISLPIVLFGEKYKF